MQRNPHPTKSGPGRPHKDGQPHGFQTAAPVGVGGMFTGQRVNPSRATKRDLLAELGSMRAVRKHLKTWRRETISEPGPQ